jgi:hypothetical protein
VRQIVQPSALVDVSLVREGALAVSLVVGHTAQVVGSVGENEEALRPVRLHVLYVSAEVGSIAEDYLSESLRLTHAPLAAVVGCVLDQLVKGIFAEGRRLIAFGGTQRWMQAKILLAASYWRMWLMPQGREVGSSPTSGYISGLGAWMLERSLFSSLLGAQALTQI